MLLSGQIVERNIDGRDGMNAQTAPAGPEGAVIEFLPYTGCFQRIGSDQDFSDIAAPEMRRRHFDERLDHMWRGISLADTGAAGLVGQAHDDGVGRAVQVTRCRVRANDGNDLNRRYVAQVNSPEASRWRGRRTGRT